MIRRFALLLLLALGLSACEVTDPLEDIELRLAVDDVPIDLGAGLTVQVSPDQPTVVSNVVSIDLGDVDAVGLINRVNLTAGAFTFTPGSAKAGVAASGQINLVVVFGGMPIGPVTLEVRDSVVQSVTPTQVLGQTIVRDEAYVSGLLERLGVRAPQLPAGWPDLTVDQAKTALRDAFNSGSVPISLLVEVTESDPDNPLVGSLRLNQITLSGTVTASQ
jgi:hypothetical protein